MTTKSWDTLESSYEPLEPVELEVKQSIVELRRDNGTSPDCVRVILETAGIRLALPFTTSMHLLQFMTRLTRACDELQQLEDERRATSGSLRAPPSATADTRRK